MSVGKRIRYPYAVDHAAVRQVLGEDRGTAALGSRCDQQSVPVGRAPVDGAEQGRTHGSRGCGDAGEDIQPISGDTAGLDGGS